MLTPFISGALTMACWVAGVFFLRFWRSSRDRLFLFFATAFWVFSLNWLTLGLFPSDRETLYYHYMVRLVAFVLIIAGIVDKNRRA